MRDRNYVLKDRSGNLLLFALPLLAIFLLLFTGILEWYRIGTISNQVDLELSRALKISADLAMEDSYRQDGESVMNCGKAETAFYSYLYEQMELNSQLQKLQGEDCLYTIQLHRTIFRESPPEIRIEGTLELLPSVFKVFGKDIGKIQINISKGIRNTRLE